MNIAVIDENDKNKQSFADCGDDVSSESTSENNINYNDDVLIYSYHTNVKDDTKISPYREILRYNIIIGLNECFQLKLKELPKNIYDINELFKNDSCKLIELINRWCWHQYNKPSCQDYVIPYVKDNDYDYVRFIDDLNYILNVHGTLNAIKEDDRIINELKKTISDYLEVEYFNYSRRNNNDVSVVKDFVDKKIRLICTYKKNMYHVVIHSKVYNRLKFKLIIFGKQYNIMKDYIGNLDNLLDQYIFCLVFRYSYMDSGNQQLAINQHIKEMYKKCGVNFELFGSAINTVSMNYCSLFYDIEKYFGSNGNFFDIQLDSGVYWCNPPYDDTIMTNTADKLISILNTDKEIALIITIPIWDVYTQAKMKTQNIDKIIRNSNKDTNSSQHTDFQIYSKLKPFIKDELIIPKHRIPYFNYKKFSYINAVNTYMLIVYNNINKNIADSLHNNFTKIIELDGSNFYCRN